MGQGKQLLSTKYLGEEKEKAKFILFSSKMTNFGHILISHKKKFTFNIVLHIPILLNFQMQKNFQVAISTFVQVRLTRQTLKILLGLIRMRKLSYYKKQ